MSTADDRPSFEDLALVLAVPADLVVAVGRLADDELALVWKNAGYYTEQPSEALAAFGQQLGLTVAQEYARRALHQDAVDNEFRRITGGGTPWGE